MSSRRFHGKGRQSEWGGALLSEMPIGEDGILPDRLMVKVDVKLGPHH